MEMLQKHISYQTCLISLPKIIIISIDHKQEDQLKSAYYADHFQIVATFFFPSWSSLDPVATKTCHHENAYSNSQVYVSDNTMDM